MEGPDAHARHKCKSRLRRAEAETRASRKRNYLPRAHTTPWSERLGEGTRELSFGLGLALVLTGLGLSSKTETGLVKLRKGEQVLLGPSKLVACSSWWARSLGELGWVREWMAVGQHVGLGVGCLLWGGRGGRERRALEVCVRSQSTTPTTTH